MYSVITRDDACASKQALGNAIDMWINETVDVYLGPPCSIGKYQYLFRWRILRFLIFICITLRVKSAPFFIPSTSFCSLSSWSWFTSSCAYHLITVSIVFLFLPGGFNGS